jgi:tetratricopeptide (TPR) repeat protein
MTEESLFALALEKAGGAERRAFLDAACGGDLRLRDRVEQLLEADERSRGILEEGPGAAAVLAACPSDTRPAPDRPPDASPSGEARAPVREADPPGYELSELVGEGGMGTVYRARDTDLRRDVAVKLLHVRFGAGGPAAGRFLGEARVTAGLQHPGVPPVHQVGTLPDGRPFLVMKLIRGRTLDDHLRDRPDPAADRGRFLAVFEQVCQALAFAHSRRVVHRDLKPSNVMVGAFGEVQVMDWGLAKVLTPRVDRAEPTALDETAESTIDSDRGEGEGTRTGTVLGTPAYMPPEQAIGAVDQADERSDVFGLGAILCAVLTGRPPYVAADFESARQLAARARLGDAFARLDGCGADPGLVALCKRCLAAEKAARPADAGAVERAVADLRAAADERARAAELDRVRAEGEAREQRKRRRVQLALAASLGLLLVAGGAVAWYSDRQATQRRVEAEGRERDEKVRLAENAKAVAALLDRCEAALRAGRADQAAIASGAAERRAADGGAEELAGRLAQCRADLALLRELDDIDAFRWTTAEGWVPARGAIVARWRAALAASGITPGDGPPAEAAGRVNGSLVRDRVLTALDAWLSAAPSAGVRAVLRVADPDPYRDAVRDALAGADGPGAAALVRRPEALTQPARFAVVLGRLGGVPAGRRRDVLGSALRDRPGDLSLLMALGNSYPVGRSEGVGERLRWFQAAVAAHPGSAAPHNNLGLALWNKGELDAAVVELREAVRLGPNLTRAHSNLGLALRDKGELDAAVAELRVAVRLDPESVLAHNNLGLVLADRGETDAALAEYRMAIRLDPKYAHAHNNLGSVLHQQGDHDGAIAAYREAIRVDPKYAIAHYNLGNVLDEKGDRDGAIAAYREAIRINPGHAPTRANLGVALWDRDPDGAVAELREAVRLDPKLAPAHNSLGRALWLKGNPDGAIASLSEAIRLDPKLAPAHDNLGLARGAKGDADGAIASFREAVRLDPTLASAHINLGSILCDVKRDYDGAIAHLREAVRLAPKTRNAHYNLGNALFAKRDLGGAITAYRDAVRLDPNFANAHFNLGSAQHDNGDLDGALASFRAVIRINPKDAGAHNNLAWVLATGPDWLRDGRRAVEHAVWACELAGWKSPIWIATLAAAHAEVGDFDKAVEFQRKALTFPDYAKRFGRVAQERQQFYARKEPYRDPKWVRREVAPPPREVRR